jgi:hypothetical protein
MRLGELPRLLAAVGVEVIPDQDDRGLEGAVRGGDQGGVIGLAKAGPEMAATTIRTIFAQPGPDQVRGQLEAIAGMLGRQFPRVEAMLREAADDITGRRSGPPTRCARANMEQTSNDPCVRRGACYL